MGASSSRSSVEDDSKSANVRAIDLLGALSLMGDMALGLSAGHGVRATYIGMCIGRELNLSTDELADQFYAGLLTDVGCTAWASQTAAAILGDDIEARRELFFFTDPTDLRDMLKWLTHYIAAGERLGVRLQRVVDFSVRGRRFMLEGLHNTSEVAARFASRLDRSPRVQDALRFAFERWDGSGPSGRRRESIPMISRITYASIFLEVFHVVGGRAAAVDLARARRGKDLDPVVVDAFLHLARKESFWQGLESESIWTLVREIEPDSPFRYFDAGRLDDAATAFGDFADLKSFYSAGHSRRVAALSESMADAMNIRDESVVTIRRAALLHDIGLVAIPSLVLHKPRERLSEAEWEMMRLHPYHAERILTRTPVFAPLCHIVAAHHERPDGKGYFRGLTDSEIPVGARILAVAVRFDELTHDGPGREALSPEAAIDVMNREAGSGLCEDALSALHERAASAQDDESAPERPSPPISDSEPRRVWPAGLTDREVEILRTLSTGASRQQMAQCLSLSEHTVRHHLEHIYSKIDVRTRVEATLFAIEHGLLA
jgi:HD-GYP domain-containing protein (c-di-GMP phosphodiesterase class II)/DNA-binding CsgD family transcriptional regulator